MIVGLQYLGINVSKCSQGSRSLIDCLRFPSSATTFVLQEFSKFGSVVKHVVILYCTYVYLMKKRLGENCRFQVKEIGCI